MNNPKAGKNLAKDVEIKPIIPRQQKSYVLPEQLRQMTMQALLTSSPKQLSVGEVNQLCNTLSQLREVK